jgi:hypothetical protein
MIVDDPVSPLTWLLDHANLVGWPSLLAITWKLKGAFDKYSSVIHQAKNNSDAAVKVAEEIKTNLSVVQNNHLAHLQADIQEMGKTYEKAYEKQIELLQSIDRGISVLVDRSSRKK